MKVVGIVARSGNYLDRSIMYMFENYRIMCLEHNVIPFIILPPQKKDYFQEEGKSIGHLFDTDKQYLKDCIDKCDGLILPGGERIYDYDKYIYEYALKLDIPILGICMGMQLMVNMDNNDKPIKNEFNHYFKKKDYAHEVSIDKSSMLYQIIKKDKLRVNSYHTYHVNSPNTLKVSALSSEGYIEAVEIPNKKFVIGVQWHPEIMYEYDLDNKKLIDAFFESLK